MKGTSGAAAETGAGRSAPFDRVDDLGDLARAEHHVHFRDQLADLVAVAFGQAAGDHQAGGRRRSSCARRSSRIVSIDSCFALSMKAQVFTMQHVSFVDARGQLRGHPPGRGPASPLGVDEVLWAAERDETNLHELRILLTFCSDLASCYGYRR